VTGSDVAGSDVTGSDIIIRSDVTGSDVIFPALFSYYSSSTKCPLGRVGYVPTFCTNTIVRKKCGK